MTSFDSSAHITPEQYQRLRAVAEARAAGTDPAHDFLHVVRVTNNARRIAEAENAQVDVTMTSALLHELFNYPKGHPQSHLSGDVCAVQAEEAMRAAGCDDAIIPRVSACIRDHAFSKGVVPESLEAKVLQDADRLDAIGAIGIARCMATCSVMQRPFYSPIDPFCRDREPRDKEWGLDHFYTKLLKIPATLHTATARALAAERLTLMNAYLSAFERELG